LFLFFAEDGHHCGMPKTEKLSCHTEHQIKSAACPILFNSGIDIKKVSIAASGGPELTIKTARPVIKKNNKKELPHRQIPLRKFDLIGR
jgi:hypothetical protein